MANAAEEHGAEQRVCSECGWGTAGFRWRRSRWPRVMLIVLPILAAMAVVFFGYQSSSTFGFGPAYLGVGLMDPVVTRGDLRRIAAGERPDRDGSEEGLASQLLDRRKPSGLGFGEARFQVALARQPRGSDSRTVRIGWPYAWVTLHSQRHWRNIISHEGPIDAVTRKPRVPGPFVPAAPGKIEVDPGLAFSPGQMVWRVPPERTRGTVVNALFPLDGAVATIVMASVVLIMARRLSRALRGRGRAWRVAGAFVMVVCPLLVILWPRDSGTYRWANYQSVAPPRPLPTPGSAQQGAMPMFDTALDPGAALTTRTLAEIRGAVPADADRLLAADILATCDDAPEHSPDDVLFASASIENWNCDSGQTDIWGVTHIAGVSRMHHERCPDFGPRETRTMPKKLDIDVGWERVRIIRSSGRAGDPVLWLDLALAGLLANVALVLAPGLVPFWTYRAIARRRESRRLRRCECPACGYPLQSPLESARGDALTRT